MRGGRTRFLLLLPVAVVVVALLWIALRHRAPARPARPVAGTSPADWAQPESTAEGELWRRVDTDGGAARLGDYYLNSGQPFAAAWQFQEAIEQARNDASSRDRATLSLAQALQAGRWYGAAERALASIDGTGPGAAVARRLRAVLLTETGRAPGVLTGSAPSLDSLTLGVVHQASGDLRRARAAYEAAAKRSPASPEALYRLGRLYLATNQHQDAPGALRRAATISSEPRFAVALGRALMATGSAADAQEAGRRFLAATEIAPAYVPAHLELGRFHQGQRRWREAGKQFLTVLRLDPRNADAHRQLAELMAVLGEPARAHFHRGWSFVFEDQPQRAVEEFRALAAADPANVEAPLLISQGYTEMVQNTRAAAEVAAALKRHPHDPRLYSRLAGLQFITHDRRAAASLCEQWRREQPDAAEPIWLQGKLAIADHRLDEGVRLLTEAAVRDPDRAEYAFDLGEVLARRPSPENLNRALASLSRAVTLSPGTARYRYRLGVVLLRLGELEGARRQFLRVLDQDPRQTQAVNSLVQVAQALRRPRQAAFWAAVVPDLDTQVREETDLRRRVGQEPGDAVARLALSRLLARRGELGKARAHLREALRSRPDARGARGLLARVEGALTVVEE